MATSRIDGVEAPQRQNAEISFKFDDFEKNVMSREAKKKQREEEERKEREEAAAPWRPGTDVPEYESVYEWVTDSSDDESSVSTRTAPGDLGLD